MRLSDLLALQGKQFIEAGREHDGKKFGELIAQHVRNFGEGAAVFVGSRLAWFGDVGGARNEARSLVAFGAKDVRVKRVKV